MYVAICFTLRRMSSGVSWYSVLSSSSVNPTPGLCFGTMICSPFMFLSTSFKVCLLKFLISFKNDFYGQSMNDHR